MVQRNDDDWICDLVETGPTSGPPSYVIAIPEATSARR